MGTPLKFEFDFDEVFEGIKQGVIRELSEANFDEAKTEAIDQIKKEIKILYQDVFSSKEKIEKETKDKVFDTLLKEVHSKYCNQFEEYIEEQLTENPNRLEEIIKEVKDELSERLYEGLYNSIRREVAGQVKESISQLCNLIGGNGIKVKGSSRTISKEEYEELLERDRKLSALEAGGVDNWEWYDESLSQYYDEED